jgi:hypothetical protein
MPFFARQLKDARVAQEHEVALPHEFSTAQRIDLVPSFATQLANRYELAVDFSLHRPHREGDDRNLHAPILTTTRQVGPDGLEAKASIECSDQDRGKKGLGPAKTEVAAIRALWAGITNEHLKERGVSAQVDHRTLTEQGVERVPATHLGVAVWGMERRAIDASIGLLCRRRQCQSSRVLSLQSELRDPLVHSFRHHLGFDRNYADARKY